MKSDGGGSLESSNKTALSEVNTNEDDISISSFQSDDEQCSDMVLSQRSDEDMGIFGNIAVTNSKDVHFGNKTYYQGPVTIKQFVLSKNEQTIDSNDNRLKNNNTNFAFESDEADKNQFSKDLESAPEEPKQQDNRGLWKTKKLVRKKLVIVTALIFSITCLCIILIVTLLMGKSKIVQRFVSNNVESQEVRPLINPTANFTLPDTLVIKTRLEWLAQPPKSKASDLSLPVPYVIISHTATENCSIISECTLHARLIQNFHIESFGWWDIGYNFLIGGDGYAYEGRGWKSEGAHTKGYNKVAIGIAFIGTFTEVAPPQRQLTAAQQLIQLGVNEGYIAQDYKLFGASQLQGTTSPGPALFDIIRKWPHWSPKP